MGNVIIIAILVILCGTGLSSYIGHVKGKGGGCCGGGEDTVAEEKELDAPKLGEKVIQIEGMHCDNCKNSVERAVNRMDGAMCKVNLKKKLAVVEYSREPDESELKRVIENLGFEVKGIS